PLLWSLGFLPAKIFYKFLTISRDATHISRWARTYIALELMYNFPERRRKREVSLGDIFWQTFSSNPRGIRNRLKLVEHLLKTIIIKKSKDDVNPNIEILSLGSGSARAIAETLAMLNGELSIKVLLLDRSRGALQFSKKLANEIAGIENDSCFQYRRGSIEDFPTFVGNFSPDIIEMVGLLDYFNESEATKLVSLIYGHIAYNGWFVVSNIIPNLEAPFITKGVGWPLVYRTPHQVKELLIKSGFQEKNIEVFIEPLKIHVIAIAQKT
ncbi:MAG: class I SAM-dependent methyltransferase family protein, partial [Candidatus Hodarchaeales archaeon]